MEQYLSPYIACSTVSFPSRLESEPEEVAVIAHMLSEFSLATVKMLWHTAKLSADFEDKKVLLKYPQYELSK